MINNIINTIRKNWKIIAIAAIVIFFYNKQFVAKEGFEEVDIIRAGCKSQSPLSDYINELDNRNQKNRTTLKPIVNINMNYANIG